MIAWQLLKACIYFIALLFIPAVFVAIALCYLAAWLGAIIIGGVLYLTDETRREAS